MDHIFNEYTLYTRVFSQICPSNMEILMLSKCVIYVNYKFDHLKLNISFMNYTHFSIFIKLFV